MIAVDRWLRNATNYLGGIGDILEDKSLHTRGIDHQSQFADVWLFRNGRRCVR
jgi:hypothetical protein